LTPRLQRLLDPVSNSRTPRAGYDPGTRALTIGVSLSLLLHVAAAIALSLQYALDLGRKLAPAQLEVVLVNSKTRSQPLKPDVYAQANLDGGGNTDEKRQAKTPLPVLPYMDRGQEVKRATLHVRELEAKQRELLSQLAAKNPIAVQDVKPQEKSQPEPQPSGVELASTALMIARLDAQIARSIDEYNQRPRKQFVGARATEVRFALYVEEWRQKVERFGNLNYPEGARGRIYGSLQLTVSINADGSIASVELERSSGHKVLDAAAARIVQMAAPYAKFPPDIRKDTDVLVITRTWHFAPGDRVFSD
jgi:protein TonB